MVVRERPFLPEGDAAKYFASFERTEIKNDCVLIGAYGNGATENEAIANYAKRISFCRIVVNAFKRNRREIQVPRLVGKPVTK
jgi:hypothetical protein